MIRAGALQELRAEFRGLTLSVWFNCGAEGQENNEIHPPDLTALAVRRSSVGMGMNTVKE